MVDKYLTLKEEYLYDITNSKKISIMTISIYEREINEFFSFLKDKDFFAVTPLEIKFYIIKMKETYSDISIKRKIASLNGFYKFLQKKGHIDNNPFFGITFTVKKQINKNQFISLQDLEKLKNSCDKTPKGIRDKLFITLLMNKENKINDIINIKISDIIKKNEICTLRKTIIKTIFLTEEEEILLDQYLKVRDLIEENFEEKLFKGLTRQNFRINFFNYCKKIGIKEISPNQIRKHIQEIHISESNEQKKQIFEKIKYEYMRIGIGDE